MNALELAEAAVSAAPAADALAHVTRERSLMLRFARNRPTQATANSIVTSSTAVACVGRLRAKRSISDRSRVTCARASAAGVAETAASASSRAFIWR